MEKEQCTCKENSCLSDCNRRHTCKTFWCEKCRPQTEELGTTVADKKVNYMQAGRAIACGHCNPTLYGEGLKSAERVIPNYKCDCKCHDTPKVAEEKKCGCGAEEKSYSDTINFPNKIVLNPPTKAEEWEVEFEQMRHAGGQFIVTSNAVKYFITSTIKSSIEEREKEIEEYILGLKYVEHNSSPEDKRDGVIVLQKVVDYLNQ